MCVFRSTADFNLFLLTIQLYHPKISPIIVSERCQRDRDCEVANQHLMFSRHVVSQSCLITDILRRMPYSCKATGEMIGSDGTYLPFPRLPYCKIVGSVR